MEQEIILENENEEQPITLESENITILDVPTDNIYTKDEVDFLLDEKADVEDIPTKVSDLNNDVGYLSQELDPLFSNSVAYGITNEDITNWNNKSTFSGRYNDLSDKPTNVSSFTNDIGYLTQHQDISGKENVSNKTTSISSNSTNTEYPSALAVYNLFNSIVDGDEVAY